MAIYNLTHVNNYMKIAGDNDVCTVCAKKLCEQEKIGASDARDKLKGKLTNKKVVYMRTSGLDQCLCLDCIKEIYDEHIAPTLPTENETPDKKQGDK